MSQLALIVEQQNDEPSGAIRDVHSSAGWSRLTARLTGLLELRYTPLGGFRYLGEWLP